MDRSPFAKLSPELRNLIAEFVIFSDQPSNHEVLYPGIEQEDADMAPQHYPLEHPLGHALFGREAAITQTCKQLRRETLAMYYAQPFHLDSTYLALATEKVRNFNAALLGKLKRLTIICPCSNDRYHGSYRKSKIHVFSQAFYDAGFDLERMAWEMPCRCAHVAFTHAPCETVERRFRDKIRKVVMQIMQCD